MDYFYGIAPAMIGTMNFSYIYVVCPVIKFLDFHARASEMNLNVFHRYVSKFSNSWIASTISTRRYDIN